MTDLEYSIITADQHAGFADATFELTRVAWPQFMFHDPVAQYFTDLYEKLPQYQFALVEKQTGTWLAFGNSIPLAFDGHPSDLPDTGWDWALEKGIDDHRSGRKPAVLCAIQVVVAADYRSQGVSIKGVSAMKEIGRAHGLSGMVAPVRPSMKSLYPLIPMERYVQWQNSDSLPFDPWMRVHARLGAVVIKVCPESMRIPGTVAEWEEWTEMRFPESGDYIIPGAVVPVQFDCEKDLGLYIEPNVWMHHAS